MTVAFLILALGLAAFSFWRAVQGYRRGQAELVIRGFPRLSADRDDDPVGFQTAIWVNEAMGLFALGCALWVAFHLG